MHMVAALVFALFAFFGVAHADDDASAYLCTEKTAATLGPEAQEEHAELCRELAAFQVLFVSAADRHSDLWQTGAITVWTSPDDEELHAAKELAARIALLDAKTAVKEQQIEILQFLIRYENEQH